MEMGMEEEILSPAVQDGREADFSPQVFGIPREHGECAGRGVEEEIVEGALVAQGQGVEFMGESEDEVEVADRQQAFQAVLQPLGSLEGLTLRAMAVAAGIVGDANVSATSAGIAVPTQCGTSTLFDPTHHPALRSRGLVDTTIFLTVYPENVGDLEPGPPELSGHDSAQQLALRLPEQIERAADTLEMSSADVGVACRHLKVAMAQKYLDDSQIGAHLQQMGGEGVAKNMRGDILAQIGRF
jgi:hypothetical protein